MIEKYGKSVADIKNSKQSFFDDNDKLVQAQNICAELYKKQPIRHKCKNCDASLKDGIHYVSHNVTYIICGNCGHVNGNHIETEEYSEYLYSDSKYGTYMYGGNAEKAKYDSRIEKIYFPKVEFLLDVLEREEQIRRMEIDLLDIGAGSGYFVSACDDAGIKAKGIELSRQQVEYGNIFLHNTLGGTLEQIRGEELEERILTSDANVISAIGVLEHLIDYHSVLKAMKENSHIRYLYMMVPMFGLSNILETLTPDVYNRHLGGPHTHVFSSKSIDFLCKTYGMEIIGKWQFGTDIMDLYRMCITKNNEELGAIIHKMFYKCIDEMQEVLDRNDFCSEIHVVLKFV